MLAGAAGQGIDLSEEDPEPLSAITSPVAASTISTCSRRASRGRLPARRGECQDREPDAATACNSDSGASRCAATYVSQPAVSAANARSQRRSPSSNFADLSGRCGESGSAAAASCSSE